MPNAPTPSPSSLHTLHRAMHHRHALHSLGYIVRAYDRAIDACDRADAGAARDAVALLRAGLDLESPTSRGFEAIYDWCSEAIVRADFIGPALRLRSLRDAWQRVVDADAAPPVPHDGRLVA